jgi:hypothetical protein
MADRDYEHDIQLLQRALHNETGSRAAVMVGAGFSFNAQKRYMSARGFPSWARLTESFVDRLYPFDKRRGESALKNAGATSGALRLAQEFEAAFGRTVLLSHLRGVLPDNEHDPGSLHSELLNLPWADVFTTNYDTLLERAALPLRERRYEVVHSVNELPLKRAPRIVKLHGSLPELCDCILTEEDYRTYPERYGPFVAEVQVAMVESYLCLVGFSGDDPNFLAWSGWVRDCLGKQTLPIYLWTFDDLTVFQTRMLEQRSIFPLPLRIITGEEESSEALRKFLGRLQKPPGPKRPRWCVAGSVEEQFSDEPRCPDAPTAEQWLSAAIKWRENRAKYPGWMIPDVGAIEAIWRATNPWTNAAVEKDVALTSLDPPSRIVVLYELVWRVGRAIMPLDDRLAVGMLDKADSNYRDWRVNYIQDAVQFKPGGNSTTVPIAELDDGLLQLKLERLRHAREVGNPDRFKQIAAEIEEALSAIPADRRSDVTHFKTYQTTLEGLSTWQDNELGRLLTDWDTSGAPRWALRRAGLMIETGRIPEAEQILKRALEEVRAINDDGTPESWSVESWIVYSLQRLERFKEMRLTIPGLVQEGTSATGDRGKSENTSGDRDVSFRDPASRMPEKSTPNSQTQSDGKDLPGLRRRLGWLRRHGCDPEEILESLEEQGSCEYSRPPLKLTVHGFDLRRWTQRVAFDPSGFEKRMVAAYRTLRLIEDAGQPLRVGTVQLGDLVAKAIRFLARCDVSEATGAVLRMRTKEFISDWFTRGRVATLPEPEARRLSKMAIRTVREYVGRPQSLAVDSIRFSQFSAGLELVSRTAARAEPTVLQELLAFAAALPVQLRVWERPHFDGAIEVLLKRICDALPNRALADAVPSLLASPVPGSPKFPVPPPQYDWTDPIQFLDGRLGVPRPEPGAEFDARVDEIIQRIMDLGASDAGAAERRYLILRLATLVDLGLFAPEWRTRLASALYVRRDTTTGFPSDTGCYDSVVLLASRVVEIDERALFRAKYVVAPWPSEAPALCSLLGSLARTGPIVGSNRAGRLRSINWSAKDLSEIAKRCREVVERQVGIVQAANLTSLKEPLRNLFPGDRERAEEIVGWVVQVLDDVLLQRDVLPAIAWNELLAAVETAERAGLPAFRVYPKLACFERRFYRHLVDGVVARLSSNDEKRVKDGLTCVNVWANQLADTRFPPIPHTVLHAIVGPLEGEYSGRLIHALDTIRNLLARVPLPAAKYLLIRAEPAIAAWSNLLRYQVADFEHYQDERMREELPDLRQAMTRLCVAVKKRHLGSAAGTAWLESVSDDPMPEIRFALAELDT